MTTLILVRHAQSAPDPALPERDWPLSERGRQQALDLAPALAELGVDALASSPFLRALETLRPYADSAGLEIAVDADLRERALGGWLPDAADVEAAVRNMHADLDFQLEGGESGRACLSRVEAALARVIAAYPGRTIAVGSHGGVLGHLIARQGVALPDAFWRRIRNPHLFIFDAEGGLRWVDERTFDGSPRLLPG
ncbi:MAG TPA: histidine phosphatase family protein [Caulobacteraceae bacterium]|jgi:2,3-bisphosphoglycerate-dependent phosphoglycerate mutase|nr:histidine phosphatase family protein [Caulobacteraceae bacterium]